MLNVELSSVGRVLKEKFSPQERRITRRSAQIRERLLDPQNSHYFSDLRTHFRVDEEKNYLKVLPSAIEREELLLGMYPTKTKPEGWQTTNPAHHDSDNFRYIVHAVINRRNNFVASLRGEKKVDDPIRKWMSIESFLNRKFTSCTLIDEVHRGTYVQGASNGAINHGFILEVPEENIVAIDPGDMGKPWDIEDEDEFSERCATAIKRRQETHSAQQFFDHGVSEFYNEVVVNGVGKGGQIKISGIFVIVEPILGIPLDELYSRNKRSRDWLHKIRKLFNMSYDDISQSSELRFFQEQKGKGMQEALDLSELLSVPLVSIPQSIHPWWYRQYILPGI